MGKRIKTVSESSIMDLQTQSREGKNFGFRIRSGETFVILEEIG